MCPLRLPYNTIADIVAASLRYISSQTPYPQSAVITDRNHSTDLDRTPANRRYLPGVTLQRPWTGAWVFYIPDVGVVIRRPTEEILLVGAEGRLDVECRIQVTAIVGN